MFTLDKIKEILDADDATTLDGYNLVRTNLLAELSPSLTEWEDLNNKYKILEDENTRLKEANITLYNKVESQILKPPTENERSGDPDGENESDEKTKEEKLLDSVNSFVKDI